MDHVAPYAPLASWEIMSVTLIAIHLSAYTTWVTVKIKVGKPLQKSRVITEHVTVQSSLTTRPMQIVTLLTASGISANVALQVAVIR